MNIKVNCKGIDSRVIEERRDQINSALDSIWKSKFIIDSINHNDISDLEALTIVADKLARKSDKVVIIATGRTAALIRAVITTVPPKSDRPEIIVFGDTLSAEEYTDIISNLDSGEFSLLVEACEEENVELLAAYTTLKKLLIGKYGSEGAMERVYILCSETNRYLMLDAVENDIALLKYNDTDGKNIGNTSMVLLPLIIAGADTGKYLEGFRQMIASTIWDLDGINYAALRASLYTSKTPQYISVWQKQMKNIGKWIWMSQYESDAMEAFRNMPMEAQQNLGNTFDTAVFLDKEVADVMMPSFPGCDEDGSLNQLTKTAMDNSHQQGVVIHLANLDIDTMGELVAFVQLSNEITGFLCKN